MSGLHRTIATTGTIATFVFVMGGALVLLGRVWATSLTQTIEVAVATPFLAGWMLAPLMWAIRPSAPDPDSPHQELLALGTSVMLVLVPLVGYGYEFFLLPVVFDVPAGLSSLLVLGVVPLLQWMVIAGSGALVRAERRREG